MIASELVKELFTDNDHLPVGEPIEPFTTAGINENVNDFIPSISESYSHKLMVDLTSGCNSQKSCCVYYVNASHVSFPQPGGPMIKS